MKKHIFLVIAILFSLTTFAQKPSNKQKVTPPFKTKFFVDEKEADILVAKLIDPNNYQSIGIEGISPADMNAKILPNKQRALRMVLKSKAKFMTLSEFFERYKVPVENQQIIKVNGDLLTIRENFLANENRIGKIELNKDGAGLGYVNIISKASVSAKKPN